MQNECVEFNGRELSWRDIVLVAKEEYLLILSDEVRYSLHNSRDIVNQIVAQNLKTYGVNTGLGALSDVTLSKDELSKLSYNTLLSHACGVGDRLSVEQTRAIMCAAVANFSHGKSGISPQIVDQVVDFLNHKITPCVPADGSVGYLTHMAHIGLALIGIGEVIFQGEQIPASDALEQTGLSAVKFGAKDGLSFVNGTPCMTGLTALALADAEIILDWATVISAMSFEALQGQVVAFDEEVLALKKSKGVIGVGEKLRSLLAGSTRVQESKGIRTQDALSLRSIPQVHGACWDQWIHAEQQVNAELNSVTDNPLILGTPDNWRVISQANPHGESVAMAADLLAIALCEIGSISERRADRLINPHVSGLPPFLVSNPGANSGMMIAQYTAASLCSDNKMLSQPAVLDNYVTSALQEDHLSFGTRSAVKLQQVVINTRQILAIEYLFSSQAFDFVGVNKVASQTKAFWAHLRETVPAWDEDRWMAPDLKSAYNLLLKKYYF